jgi:stage III sporulation protein AE
MRKNLRGITFIIIIILSFIIMNDKAYGAESSNNEEQSEYDLSSYDFSVINKSLESEDIDFKQLVVRLASGESNGIFYEIFTMAADRLFYELTYNRKAIIKIIFIAVISALFTNMSLIIKKSEMAETGFYITYMLMVTILAGGFIVMSDMVKDAVSSVITFMDALVPAFMLAVGAASGSLSAAGFAGIIILSAGIIEKIILSFLIPAVNIYVVIMLVNNISDEDYFSKFADVIKTAAVWTLKGMMGLLIGADIIQGIIMPSVDAAGTGVINKIIKLLPGGDALTGMEEIAAATGSVVKNAIGSAGLIVLAVISIFPIMKILVYIAAYKITQALIQPITDKRIEKSIEAVSEGAGILCRITYTVALLLFITIAVICYSTNLKIGI